MFQDFWMPFLAVGLAELGDKTQLGIMLLASKTSKKWRLFLGAMLGFLIVDGTAVLAGASITKIISPTVLQWISAVFFVLFGLWVLKDSKEASSRLESEVPRDIFRAGFLMICAAEWGDKTQLASGLFAAKYHAVSVLAGALASLGLLTGFAILAGHWVSKKVPEHALKKIAGILFLWIGVSCFFSNKRMF